MIRGLLCLWLLLFGLGLKFVVNQPTLDHNKHHHADSSRTKEPDTMVPPQLVCSLGILSLGAENTSASPPSIMAQPRGLLGRPKTSPLRSEEYFVVLLLSLLSWMIMDFFVQRFQRDYNYFRPVWRPELVAAG